MLVFVPYTIAGGGLSSPDYDFPEFRADVASWMAALGLEWEWVAVTAGSLRHAIDRARRLARGGAAIVLNLCDGDDINGYPGLSVVAALEAARVPFTGAASGFYAVSTSKLAMKRRFAECGVATAEWVAIRDADADLRVAAARIGFPLFLKPDVAFASAGISLKSVVRDHASAVQRVEALFRGMHGCRFEHGGVLAEPFIEGPEFTVLVVSDPAASLGVKVLTPCERVFHSGLPPGERFLTFERSYEEYDEDPPLPAGEPYYRYAPAPQRLRPELAELARQAFQCLAGTGYARVDLRGDAATGRLYVLEVNANCGLPPDDTYASPVDGILSAAGETMTSLVQAILADGWSRHSVTKGNRD